MSEQGGPSLNQTLSRNLRFIYAMRRQNLEEFSRELGVGHTTVQNIFRQKSNLTLDTVELIAGNLDMSPIQLLSEHYPQADLTCSMLLLETLELFQPLPDEKRKQATALFCQLLELLSAGNREKMSSGEPNPGTAG